MGGSLARPIIEGIKEVSVNLPGHELVSMGLDDLAVGRESEASLLVAMAAPRLRALGFEVPDGGGEQPSYRLYELLTRHDGSAHSRYNSLVSRVVSFARAAEHAPPVDELHIRTLMRELGRLARAPVRIYLTGGSTAVVEGWREATIDVDLRFEPEADELLRSLPALKERLRVNVELASPPDSIPELPDWRERSPFLFREGSVDVHHFDFYSQALSKIERSFGQDLADVRSMIASGLVEPPRLRELYEAIEPELYRYPAINPPAFRQKLDAALSGRPME